MTVGQQTRHGRRPRQRHRMPPPLRGPPPQRIHLRTRQHRPHPWLAHHVATGSATVPAPRRAHVRGIPTASPEGACPAGVTSCAPPTGPAELGAHQAPTRVADRSQRAQEPTRSVGGRAAPGRPPCPPGTSNRWWRRRLGLTEGGSSASRLPGTGADAWCCSVLAPAATALGPQRDAGRPPVRSATRNGERRSDRNWARALTE